jgi:hypothetical protein
MHDLYPPLKLPAVDASALKRGTRVQTRIFCADSLPGNKATVVRVRKDKYGTDWVRCNYGKNLSGKSLLKWMDAGSLSLA